MKILMAFLRISRILAMFDSNSSSSGTLHVMLHDSINLDFASTHFVFMK